MFSGFLGERPFGKPAESEAKAVVTETDAAAKDADAEDIGAAEASAAVRCEHCG